MKELDVLLEKFLADSFDQLAADKQAAFQRLLSMEDPDLYACLLGQQSVSDSELADVIAKIRRCA